MADEARPAIVQPRSSSAVMLLRNLPSGQGIEVFMVRRVIQSDFMPDVYVFPGGSVSADDRAAELAQDVCMPAMPRSEEHTSELQSLAYLVCRLLLEKKKQQHTD